MRYLAAVVMAACVGVVAGQEPKKDTSDTYIHFEKKAHVELQKSRGMINLDGSFTVEMWVRWEPEVLSSQSLVGDLAWKGMSADLPEIGRHSGWTIRTTRVEDADLRAIEFAVGATEKGKTDWVYVTSSKRKDIKPGEWQHIAVAKSLTSIKLFWNGKLVGEKPVPKGVKFHACPTPLYLGVRKFTDGVSMIDIRDFRVSKTARYTRDFIPEERFRSDANTDLLLDLTLSPDANRILDTSGNERDGILSGAKVLTERRIKKG